MEDIPEIDKISESSAPMKDSNFSMDCEIPPESIDAIYESLLNKEGGMMCHLLMKHPLKEIYLFASSKDGKSFDLVSNIVPVATAYWGKMKDIVYMSDQIALSVLDDENIEDLEDFGGAYILPGHKDSEFVMSVDDEQQLLSISTGEIIQYDDEIEAGLKPDRILDSPALTKENLELYLHELVNLTMSATSEFYAEKTFKKKYAPILKISKLEEPVETEDYSMGIGDRNALIKKIEVGEKLNLTFDDVGGQKEAKDILELCSLGFKNPEVYKKWGAKFPRGILLYGPPGTGKTLMAKVLASSSDARFLNVRWADIASGWYGESERALKDIFDNARKGKKRTIIFFDEIDTLAPPRSDAYEGSQKVVGTLLSEMDGLRDSSNILVIGATNNPAGVDGALKRGGRFDFMIKVDSPDQEARLEIFSIHMRKANEYSGRILFGDIDWDTIAAHTNDLNGSDIAEIVRRVLEEKAKMELHGYEAERVNTEDLTRTIKSYKPEPQKRRAFGFLGND